MGKLTRLMLERHLDKVHKDGQKVRGENLASS